MVMTFTCGFKSTALLSRERSTRTQRGHATQQATPGVASSPPKSSELLLLQQALSLSWVHVCVERTFEATPLCILADSGLPSFPNGRSGSPPRFSAKEHLTPRLVRDYFSERCAEWSLIRHFDAPSTLKLSRTQRGIPKPRS